MPERLWKGILADGRLKSAKEPLKKRQRSSHHSASPSFRLFPISSLPLSRRRPSITSSFFLSIPLRLSLRKKCSFAETQRILIPDSINSRWTMAEAEEKSSLPDSPCAGGWNRVVGSCFTSTLPWSKKPTTNQTAKVIFGIMAFLSSRDAFFTRKKIPLMRVLLFEIEPGSAREGALPWASDQLLQLSQMTADHTPLLSFSRPVIFTGQPST